MHQTCRADDLRRNSDVGVDSHLLELVDVTTRESRRSALIR
jgi:hypothetical protein